MNTIKACTEPVATVVQLVTSKASDTLRREADSYAYEKLKRKWTKSVFFGFFQSYGYANGPDSYGQIRLSFS